MRKLPGSIQQMDYALRMLLITASRHFSRPHLMQGVLEMFEANPVMITEKIKCLETLELVNQGHTST